MMKRREFIITLLGSATAIRPVPARGQPSGKTYRIGFLGVTSQSEYRRQTDALRTGLRQLGYEEGRNILIEYRWAEGGYDRLPELASELAKLNVDVIVTHSTPASRAAKEATSTIPIVMAAVIDPVETGLVPSLHRPGGNLTGSTFFVSEVGVKRVELIKEVIPTLTRLAVLVNAANPIMLIAVTAVHRAAAALGVEIVPIDLKTRDDIAPAIPTVATRRAQALLVIEEPLTISHAKQIADLALQNRLPMIGFKPQAEAGALLEYGVDLADLYFRSASFVDRILRGTPPADLPIERAVKFELIVNLKTARTLGITVPLTLIASADEVIE